MKEIMELKILFNSKHRADAIVSLILALPIVLAGLISRQNDYPAIYGGIVGVMISMAYDWPHYLIGIIFDGLMQLFVSDDSEAGGIFLLVLILKTAPVIWFFSWSGVFFVSIKIRRLVLRNEPIWQRYILSIIISLTLSISSLVVFSETTLLALCLNGKSLSDPWSCFSDLTENDFGKLSSIAGKLQYCQQFSSTKTIIPKGPYTLPPNTTHRELCVIQVASNAQYTKDRDQTTQKINVMPSGDERDRLREEAISNPTADACKLYGQLEKSNYAKDRCLSRFIQLGPNPSGLDDYCPALSDISLEPRCLDWNHTK